MHPLADLTLDASPTGTPNPIVEAVRDPVVAQVLRLFHAQPSHPWTLPKLAREVAASRTVVAERFTAVVGIPPMTYLTHRRIDLAAEALRRDRGSIASIAARVGYRSEAAFSRAFKRRMGRAPGEWRRLIRAFPSA